ncbi:MAG: hypothetical protein SFU98_16355 [Leptospiraceae bacterium]|nr:hypothetical protein [Leptospiraceae bacterium]
MRKKPLVLTNGRPEELQAGDQLDLATEMDITDKVNGESVPLVKGQAVTINGSGQVILAKADAAGTANVLGFVRENTIDPNVSGSIQIEGQLELIDWTDLTGGADLSAGSDYYLSASDAGKLTTVAPTTPGQYVCFVGFAVSAKTLFVKWDRVIRL